MIICLCSGIDDKTIKDFLKSNPSDKEWENFLDNNKLSKDCGSCLNCIISIKDSFKKSNIDLE